jgi:hypothetical protein
MYYRNARFKKQKKKKKLVTRTFGSKEKKLIGGCGKLHKDRWIALRLTFAIYSLYDGIRSAETGVANRRDGVYTKCKCSCSRTLLRKENTWVTWFCVRG